MITKADFKHIIALHQKKYRFMHSQFIVEGNKLVEDLLKSNFRINKIVATAFWTKNNHEFSNFISSKFEIDILTEKDFERISQQTTPSGILAVVYNPIHIITNYKPKPNSLTLVLDNINDPGNLGTIIRIADWFGVETIICSEDTVDMYNHKVVQSTMGSIFRVKVIYTDLITFISENKNNQTFYAAVMNGNNIYKMKFNSSSCIVIGNESHGVSEKISSLINNNITIPSFSSANGAESLNASIATGIICSEFVKQAL